MLKGTSTASLDKKGRIKIPPGFRKAIEDEYGKEVFVTSIDDKRVIIYPFSAWTNSSGIKDKKWLTSSSGKKVLIKAKFNGKKEKIDKNGRVSIHKVLRDRLDLGGKVVIEEKGDHLILKKT